MGNLWNSFLSFGNNALSTVGQVMTGAIDAIPGAKTFFDAYDWTMARENQVAVWGLSALPGGPRTATWDEANQISFGQMARTVESQAYKNPAVMAATNAFGFGFVPFIAQVGNKPYAADNFDIYNPEMRKAAFEDDIFGRIASGVSDAAFDWYADPGVVLGKATKVARFGMNLGDKSFMGLTNRTVRTEADRVVLAAELDAHQLWLQSGGVAGKQTAFGTAVERTLSKDAAQVYFDPIARSSTNRNLVSSLLGESTDFRTSALIVKAGLGDFNAVRVLEQEAASTADALTRATRLSDEMAASMRKPITELTTDDWWIQAPEFVDRQVRIVEDLTARDKLLQNALDMASNVGTIRKAGSAFVTMERFKTASVARATRRKYDPNARTWSNAPGWAEQIFQRNPWVRPTRVWHWASGERPAGQVVIDGAPSYDSATELFAALDSTPVLNRNAETVALKQQLMNDFLAQDTVEGRMQSLVNIESAVLGEIAAKYGVDKAVAQKIYESFNKARSSATKFFQERGFLVDTDGTVIRSPALRSQLAEAVPMMDFRLMEALVRRQQSSLRRVGGGALDVADQVLTPFYTAWKASVLFRVGYTIRNVLEGNLRSAAAVGFIPMLAEPKGSLVRFARNAYRREMASMSMAADIALGRSPRHITDRIKQLRDARVVVQQDIERNLYDTTLLRTYEPDEAIGWASMPEAEYIARTTEHGTQFNLADFEGAVLLPPNDTTRFRRLLGSQERSEFQRLHELQQNGEVLTGSEAARYRTLRAKASRSYLRDLQAAGLDVVVRDGKTGFRVVRNPSDIPDEVLVPLPKSRRGVPAQAVEDQNVGWAQTGFDLRATPNLTPDIYLVERWRPQVQASVAMGQAVPGRVARQARVKNPKPVTQRIPDPTDAQQELGARLNQRLIDIDEQIADYEERLRQTLTKRTKYESREYYGDSGAFAGDYGPIARKNASADQTYENVILDSTSLTEQRLQRETTSWGRIDPEAPNYWSELTHVANYQFRNDAVGKLALAGQPMEEARAWIMSRKGADYRKQLRINADNVDDHVRAIYDMIDRYIPDPALRMRLAEDVVPGPEIRAALENRADITLSPIHGRDLQAMTTGGKAAEWWNDTISHIYKILGTIPENRAVRHPFYANMWETESSRLLDMARRQGIELTDEAKLAIDAAAHKFALRETKRTLYTIERYSNPAIVLKWLMPFFPAIENTFKVWLRLGWNDPSIIARANLIWNAPNRMGMVVDSEMNPVPAGATFSSDQFIRLPESFRKALSKYTPGGLVPDIPKGSINVVLQGETPVLPGLGPMVTVPASMMVAAQPGLEDTIKQFVGETGYRTLIPFGRPSADPLDYLLPAVANRVRAQGDENSGDFAKSIVMIWRDMHTKWLEGGQIGPEPKADQAIEQAREYWKLRTWANAVAPFSLRFTTPYDFYIDKYREYTQQLGYEDGLNKFREDFPNYTIYAESITQNTTGMESSQQAYSMLTKNQSLWNEIVNLNPKLGQLITNPTQRGEFSDAVYEWQQGRPIAPGSSDTFRDPKSVQKFRDAYYVHEGWADYMAKRAIVDEMLAQRGLTSVTQKGAEDIADAWRQYKDKLAADNPAWDADFKDHNSESTIDKTIKAFSMIAANPQFRQTTSNPTMWTFVDQYLQGRQTIIQMLQDRENQGKSGTFSSNSNADIQDAWEQYVAKLTSQNTDFADLYNRWLDGDSMLPVTMASGTGQ